MKTSSKFLRMSFLRCLLRLCRLFLGLSVSPDNDRVSTVRLDLFDRIPLLKKLSRWYFFSRIGRYLPFPATPTHAFCVGRSGSGKSELLKLVALAEKTKPTWTGKRCLRRDQTLVLIDPHGDLAQQLARQRPLFEDYRKHPHDPNLIYLDPCLAIKEGLSPVLNPFELYGHQHTELEREKAVQQLTAVLSSLTCKPDEALSTNMETLLYPCLSVLLSRADSTLFDLLRFMDSSGNEDLIRLGVRAPNTAHRYFFEHSFNDPRFRPTRGALSTKVQSLLNSRAFSCFLAQPHSSLNLEAALNSGKTIVLNCSAGQLGVQTMSAIGRFFVGMVLAVAFNRRSSLRSHRPIRLILDEMHHFVSDELSTILNEARKYGLYLTLACQIVGHNMSSQLNRAILGNSSLKLLGDAGADSRQIMAREMGIQAAEAESLSVGQFIIRHRHYPPAKVQCTDACVGYSQAISRAQWGRLKEDQIRRFYIRASKPDPPDEGHGHGQELVLPNTLDDFISSSTSP